MKAKLLVALALIAILSPAWAQPSVGNRARLVAPFVDDQTIAVGFVDFQRLPAGEALRRVAAVVKVKDALLQEASANVAKLKEAMAMAGVREAYLVVSLADVNSPFVVIVPVAAGADGRKMFDLLEPLVASLAGRGATRTFAMKDGRFFLGSEKAVRAVMSTMPSSRPELESAFAAAGDSAAHLLFIPSKDQHRVVSEMLRELPQELGRVSGKQLSAGIRWAALSVDDKPALAIRGVVQSADAEAARTMHGLALDLLRQLGRQRGPDGESIRTMFDGDFDKFVQALTPKVDGERVTVRLDGDQLTDVLARMYILQTEKRVQMEKMHQLKQIGLAMHNYADSFNSTLPAPAMSGALGAKPEMRKPHLSWRVYLLPYLEQDALFREFRLDEPWDSEHNRKLIARMPAVYRPEEKTLADGHKTRIVVPLIKNGIFEPGGAGTRFAEIFDGTSNTIMILEAAPESAVTWTKPDDLPVDEMNPAKGIFGKDDVSVPVGFADGSVRRIPKTIGPKDLLWLILRNDGHAVKAP